MQTKITLILLAALAALPIFSRADTTTADALDLPVMIETVNEDGSTNTWTQADLVAALQLLNRKYHREVATPGGRQAWHGKMIREEVDLERAVKIETHEDGMAFEIPFSSPKKATPKPATLNAEGVPVALARARKRREQEKATTNEVTIITKAGEVEE
ncbi:MAG: hypothetical protein IKO64_01075 [Kiritimatiellae bacterium]|nr:hypothetical protein [Kiritimatiellia bacterium]